MLKVLLLNDQMLRGGKERRIVELLKYCKAHYDIQFEVMVMHSHVDYPEMYDTGYKIHFINWSRNGTLANFKKVLSISKSFNPDIIHSWSSMSDIAGLYLKLMTGKKLISSMIARVTPYRSIFDKEYRRSLIVFPFTNAITANTYAGIESYKAPKSKSICVYNGFNFDRLKKLNNPDVLKEKYNLHNKFVVGMVAAFEDRKDHPTAINAAIELIKKYPGEIAFFFIGYGKHEEASHQLAGKYAENNQIIFTGMSSLVEDYINIFDVGILCTNSDIHGEGISNSIMEYMAMAKPVIATEGGGTNEIVTNNETGFLIEPKNPALLQERIEYVMTHPGEAKAMGAKGIERIKKDFSIESMGTGFYNIYNQVTGKKNLSIECKPKLVPSANI